MKKVILPLLLIIESIILILFIVFKNKNTIVSKQDVYDFNLDNGCKGQFFVDNTSKKQISGFSCVDKNNNYTGLIFDKQLLTVNFRDNSIYALNYETDNGKFVIYTNNFEDKNITYAIKYSDTPQVIKVEDFYKNGIVFQPEEPNKN